MELSLVLSISLFAITTSITPGPNNTILLATGLNFGFKKAWPFLMGIMLGMTGMLTVSGLGLSALFHTFPVAFQVLKYVGFAYLLYIAWNITRSSGIKGAQSLQKPLGLWQATGAQWLNPKAWIVVPTFIASYVPVGSGFLTVALCYFIFLAVTLPGAMVWAAFGQGLRKLFKNERQRTIFNWAMAILLVASMFPVIFFS
ncbi:MAG: LysE family translocator [Aquiluna sp.]|nr:LysE family translocator [Aquiluna sp.]MCF8546158.1 LysE family translocator [Aquiluna sp.]